MADLANFESSNAYSPLEKLVLRYAEDLTRKVSTSEDVFNELRKHLNETQMVELNLIVGLANLTNRFNESFKTDVDTRPRR